MGWGFKSFLTLLLLIAVPVYAGTPLSFDPAPKGLNFRLARIALVEHIKPAEDTLQRVIPFSTARFDLNQDGVPELFVKLLEEKFFCDSSGCDIFVLSVKSEGPKIIGTFRGSTLEVEAKKNKNHYNLKVLQAGGENFNFYEWQDANYTLQED